MNEEVIRIDLNGVNCYLIKGTDGYILFDTGGSLVMDKTFTNRRTLLLNELKKAGCTQQSLSLIILTHGDCDHAGNAAYLKSHFNAQIAMHGGDKSLVEKPILEKWMKSFQYRSWVYRTVFRLFNKPVTEAVRKALDDFMPFSPDILLEDGYDLSPYGLNGKVIHLPGHTDGAIGILTDAGNLIAGDTPAPNAVDFNKMDESIRKLKAFPVKMIYPGHGKPYASLK